MKTENIERLLRLTGFDYTNYLWWRTSDETDELAFYISCNDFFYWGTADLEEITDKNLDSLEETVRECEAIQGKWNGEDGFLLWCARTRGMRPQGAYYSSLDKELWHLFDAAGPEREVGFGNPKSRPVGENSNG